MEGAIMSNGNYPDDIGNSIDNPSSPIYRGTELDCGHRDIDDCECEDRENDSDRFVAARSR
jgi:hypothetical protein